MAVTAPTVQVIVVFLSLVPGYVAYATARLIGHVTIPLKRFEKTLWSLLGSGVSISVLYFLYTTLTSITQSRLVWPNVVLTIESLAVAFPLLLLVASGLGVVSGTVVRNRNIRELSKDIPEPTWNYLMKKARNAEEPIEVRVNTDAGDEIQGYLGAIGTTNDMRDLLLVYPQTIRREDGRITDRITNGAFVYVRENAISSIFFDTDLDLDLSDRN
ncbi:DUF6338 family protein [Halorussus salinus]|uniref:DUF6338 family protein n=1 Tax=Halorussus salinus TaxID=1364935 RepID=UPI0010918AFC|nr:DUF6338 family protein [Halorussus salinus]